MGRVSVLRRIAPVVPAEFPTANRAYAVGMGRILDFALACLKR